MTVHRLPTPWVDRIAEVTRESRPTGYDPPPLVFRKTSWVSLFLFFAAGYVIGAIDNRVWDVLVHWWRTNP